MTAPATEMAAENWLTYNGDRRGSLGQLMGPNTIGQVSTVIAAEYDPATNKTRLGLLSGDVRDEIRR